MIEIKMGSFREMAHFFQASPRSRFTSSHPSSTAPSPHHPHVDAVASQAGSSPDTTRDSTPPHTARFSPIPPPLAVYSPPAAPSPPCPPVPRTGGSTRS